MSLEKLASDLKVNPQDAENILDYYYRKHSVDANTSNLRLVRSQVENARRILAGITEIGGSMEKDLELSVWKAKAQNSLEVCREALAVLEEEASSSRERITSGRP